MAKVNLSPPWDIYYREINAFFEEGPEVKVLFDEEERVIKLYVDNGVKATALGELLPLSKDFGGTTLRIEVIPSNYSNYLSSNPALPIIRAAFTGNPIVQEIKTVSGLFSYDLNYVLFKKEVVQYYTDNLGDYNGYCSTLYENIARDIFNEMAGVFYCTSDQALGTFTYTYSPNVVNSPMTLCSSQP